MSSSSSSSDPSNFLNTPNSNNQQPTIVKVQGTSRDELNGQLGMVLHYNTERGRYSIHMVSSQTTCALKPDNIIKGTMIETYRAQFDQLRNDPRIHRHLLDYYNRAQSMLPPIVKPEYVLGGVFVVLALCMYFIGFSKTLMFLSMITLVGVLVAPDIMKGGQQPISWRVVATNFPQRCRESIEQTVPFLKGKVSNKMAAGVVFFMILMSSKVLFTSPTTKNNKVATAPSSSASSYSTTSSSSNRAMIEEAYKWGFEDGKNDMYGQSLPDEKQPQDIDDDDDEIQYDYIPSSTTSSSSGSGGGGFMSKLGISQAMSVFYIYRTATQLGNNAAGIFSMEVLKTNVRNLPPWQLGIFGFSLYNLLRPFF